MPTREENVLVLQGGGALGAYQAGACWKLADSGIDMDWVAGISIGSVNAAILCGNPPGQRFERLRTFWEQITARCLPPPVRTGARTRSLYSDIAAAEVVMFGAPGFFRPRLPMAFWPVNPAPPLGVYDTSPLAETLNRLVDFDYLNDKGPRLSVGAVDVQSGNFVYFDSRETRLDARHIMASGALPPGFPPVEIDGRLYWDGGLVSNTPLQYVMQHTGKAPLCIFQIDLFSARGEIPASLADVQQREKDIRYSSRTRLTTDRFRYLHSIRAAASRLARKLPEELRDDPDLAVLRAAGPDCPITLVHLIHRKAGFESMAKDYEFSRLSMLQHWETGAADVGRTLSHANWKSREIGKDALQVFDLGAGRRSKGDEG